MRLREVSLLWYRSVDHLEFEVGPLTVLFGKNNSGKTNVIEAIYGVLSPDDMNHYLDNHVQARGLRGPDDLLPPYGAVVVELEPGAPFDDDVINLRDADGATLDGDVPLAPLETAFVGFEQSATMTFTDPRNYFRQLRTLAAQQLDDPELDDRFRSTLKEENPRPYPLFLDWEIDDIDARIGNALIASLGSEALLELAESSPPRQTWQVRPELQERLDLFSRLATDLLPDFINGSVYAYLHVATEWGSQPSVSVTYRDHQPDRFKEQRLDEVYELGRGSARWVAVAIQIALHLLTHTDYVSRAESKDAKPFSGHILFLDEPEAHLHPSAVTSIVRWCRRMLDYGFNIIVATHHDEFLRISGPDIRHVHVTRREEPPITRARTLLTSVTPLLQDLANEVGAHPASVLSLHRGVLFVEGPLDHAVLDEYAASALDAAGVLIIPMHGTRNMEGLIDGELAPRLGLKMGVLTDATDPETMGERSNRKRTREEIWVTRLIKRCEDQGLPLPTAFGVPEDDLLFVLPADGIRQCYPDTASTFPGWLEMREECREALGMGKSDSVDWKRYADDQYGLPLTTAAGVRSVVRRLDFAGFEFPSVQRVIDQVVAWASQDSVDEY
ncbi:ATP-dependent nuclease [Mycolicibacter kumamotonensis]|nr:ATP-binding protein [Mycolicibacter kumamotonensis]